MALKNRSRAAAGWRKSPRWRRARRIYRGALAAVACILVLILLGVPVYVLPVTQVPATTDVIFVIGPPSKTRLDLAQRLVEWGVAKERLVIVYWENEDGEPEHNRSAICEQAGVTCVIPRPSSTKGEVNALQRYSALHHVENAIVITFNPHVARTQFIFDKCFNGNANVIGVPMTRPTLGDWIYQYVYQSAAFVKAWATPCDGGID